MACPHCGTRLLHKQQQRLLCCGCGRTRLDLDAEAPLKTLRRHGPLLLAGLLGLPLPLGLAVLDGVRQTSRDDRAGAAVISQPGPARPAVATLSAMPRSVQEP